MTVENQLTPEEIKKIQDALGSTKRALVNLRLAKKNLEKAKNWGVVDIVGGGLLTTAIKRSKMKDAKVYINSAGKAMENLSKELECLSDCKNIDFKSIMKDNKYITFGDYIFDCGLMDLFAQSKIHDAKKQCVDAIAKVEEIQKVLESQLTKN